MRFFLKEFSGANPNKIRGLAASDRSKGDNLGFLPQSKGVHTPTSRSVSFLFLGAELHRIVK